MNASIQVGAVSAFLQKQADNREDQEKEGKARSRASEGRKPKKGENVIRQACLTLVKLA